MIVVLIMYAVKPSQALISKIHCRPIRKEIASSMYNNTYYFPCRFTLNDIKLLTVICRDA